MAESLIDLCRSLTLSISTKTVMLPMLSRMEYGGRASRNVMPVNGVKYNHFESYTGRLLLLILTVPI